MAYNEIFEESEIQICQIPPSLARLDISHSDIKVDTNALIKISIR